MESSSFQLVAFIPLRGGSRSIPGKNIKPLGGQPLAYWALDACEGCSRIQKVFVATDDATISETIRRYPSNKVEVVSRSPETATDSASTESAMLEFAENVAFEQMVLIQATSPLLTTADLNRGLDIVEQENLDTLLSGTMFKRFVWDRVQGNTVQAKNYDPLHRPLRQQWDGQLLENGAFYVCSREGLLKHKSRLHGKIGFCEMDEESAYELDEVSDWTVIEEFLRRRGCRPLFSAELNKVQGIKLFLTDVDGVLTDAGMYYSERGDELKKFNTRDGKAFELLRLAGIKIGIITAEDTEIVARRAKKLECDILHQGVKDKASVVQEVLNELGFGFEELAYVGDDLNDVDVLSRAGFSACPSDAEEPVKKVSDLICSRAGGRGVVREAAEIVLSGLSENSREKG